VRIFVRFSKVRQCHVQRRQVLGLEGQGGRRRQIVRLLSMQPLRGLLVVGLRRSEQYVKKTLAAQASWLHDEPTLSAHCETGRGAYDW
jgi:hypothetical protein